MMHQLCFPLKEEGIYILQTEEVDLGLQHLSKFAEIVRREIGMTAMEASVQIKKSFGIFLMPDMKTAEKISPALEQEGIKNGIVTKLFLPLQPVPRGSDNVSFQPRLICAGMIVLEKSKASRPTVLTPQHVVMPSYQWYSRAMDLSFVIDALNEKIRVQKQDGGLTDRLVKWLIEKIEGAEKSFDGYYLSRGVETILKERRDVPRFRSFEAYERYLAWLLNISLR